MLVFFSSSLFAKNTDDEITKLQKQLAQIQAELADLNDKTKFYGRLSMAKNWSQMGWMEVHLT